MKYFIILTFLIVVFTVNSGKAQVLTPEDSLAAGLVASDHSTLISGYGEARYTLDTKRKTAEASLSRVVLFIGHKFSKKISVFTETELEDAVVAGGEEEGGGFQGEISIEQAFLKFDLNPSTYLVAGLIIPRLGIINENHLPTTYNGVDRPFVEQLVIPSTWREVGVGIYGNLKSVPGLNYSLLLTNGMNSKNFENGSGIREGRQLGSKAKGLGMAVNGSVLYYINNFRLQASGYIGGSTAEEGRVADSLQLNKGAFGNPVIVGELDAQYSNNGLAIRALAATVSIPNADNINKGYNNNTPENLFGAYGELSYNVLYNHFKDKKALNVFGRYEFVDMNASVPYNGVKNDINQQQYIIGGVVFKPVRGVAIKMDYVQRITGEPNQNLIVTPFPEQVPYYSSNGFFNLGVAYNF